jgi:hypothetical protein
MAGFVARAAGALRDPWSLVVTAIGAGSAWAAGLPLAGVGAVGVGMLAAAAVAGGALSRARPGTPEIDLVRGTTQKSLVDELESYRRDLVELQHSNLTPVLASSSADAVAAADSAAVVALRVASAVDALDLALSRATTVASRMPASTDVRGSIARMAGRRQELLLKLTAAVNGVGEVYTGLLELSSTAQLAGLGTDGLDEVNRVNDSLDALRGAFEELERDASASRALL